ncbi:sulfotransferase family 2 domain-containing protein [Pseudoalteromonas maricaloris]
MKKLYLALRAVSTDLYYRIRKRKLPVFVKQRGVLFIHVPKAAGMSITTALYNREVGHYKLRDYESYECTTFSVVRNPYDRLVSAYSFLMQGGSLDIEEIDIYLHIYKKTTKILKILLLTISPTSVMESIFTLFLK